MYMCIHYESSPYCSEPGENGVGVASSTKVEPITTAGSSISEAKVETDSKPSSNALPEKTNEKPEKINEKGQAATEPKLKKEGSPKQPPGEGEEGRDEKQEQAEEDEKERKEKMKEDIFELNEQLSEAVSAVNLRPLGFDRYHRKYWMFPNLPGLFVEDPGDISPSELVPFQANKLGDQSQTESTADVSLETQKAEKCLSPEGILVKSQPNPSFERPSSASRPSHQAVVIAHTRESPTVQLQPSAIPKPPALIPISETISIVREEEKRLSVNNSSMVSATSSVFTPGERSVLDESEVSMNEEIASMHVPYVDKELRPRWYFYRSLEEIDRLLESLNPRGIREINLKRVIDEQRSHFEKDISECPFQSIGGNTSSQPPQLAYTCSDEYMELYLREQILDIEEKIHLGSLGYLRDVEERAKWRDMIENSGAAASLDQGASTHGETQKEAVQYSKHPCSEEKGRSRSTTPLLNEDGSRRKSSPPPNPSVHELSRALLQVQAGIEKKYLLPPLGMAVDKKRRRRQKEKKVIKESDVCVEEWRASLAKATSYSQIFVHLATLERCVMWSKSLMNVRCRICRRKCGDEFMLLCDGCDHGYHTYCLKPPLKYVPEGDWFCHDCHPVTPVKPRRRAQRVVIVEESSESEPEEEIQESEEEEEGSEQEEADDEEESEEEEVQTTRRSLRSSLTRSAEVTAPSRGKGSRGKPSTRVNSKKQVKFTRGKVSKVKLAEAKKPETGTKRPRGRPPGKPKGRRSSSSQTLNTSSSTPDSSSGRNGPSARKKLKMDSLPLPMHQSKAESVIASIIDLRCSRQKGRPSTSSSRREQKSLEAQLCEALWEEVSEQDNSVHFELPIKKKEVSPTEILVLNFRSLYDHVIIV